MYGADVRIVVSIRGFMYLVRQETDGIRYAAGLDEEVGSLAHQVVNYDTSYCRISEESAFHYSLSHFLPTPTFSLMTAAYHNS